MAPLQEQTSHMTIEPVIAGPILRRLTSNQVTFWIVTSQPTPISIEINTLEGQTLHQRLLDQTEQTQVPVGTRCYIQLIDITLDTKLPHDTLLTYDLMLTLDDGIHRVSELASHLLYLEQDRFVFCIKSDTNRLLHGSCRKPHHIQTDALVRADQLVESTLMNIEQKPSLMLFSGDQVYCDDVAGPMLYAIHQIIQILGLFDETWDGSIVKDSATLFKCSDCYYRRESLLPSDNAHQQVIDKVFHGAKKPIFTTVHAHNHLITLSEALAMYLLVWSDEPWRWIEWDQQPKIPENFKQQYADQLPVIQAFARTLPNVRRTLAHIPTYMIFDDHDVTDDWNLTRGWEETAYNNPFSRRIIGNSLIAYYLCQGWGNQPEHFESLTNALSHHFLPNNLANHNDLIDQLLNWSHWHYTINTHPKIVVLDTRTHRWRSESSPANPSGLMDWESLSELQQQLINERQVILVSPAPVFGLKLIEVVQKIFTYFGQALMVDAENWMSHRGAAMVILNIFQHANTADDIIILSGDVHYSFASDITLRSRHNDNQILQVTASGIKNSFPAKLIACFDHLNRWLYSARSPLNWFTKRRKMRIKSRAPTGGPLPSLYNHSGIGLLEIGESTQQTKAWVLDSEGADIEFIQRKKS